MRIRDKLLTGLFALLLLPLYQIALPLIAAIGILLILIKWFVPKKQLPDLLRTMIYGHMDLILERDSPEKWRRSPPPLRLHSPPPTKKPSTQAKTDAQTKDKPIEVKKSPPKIIPPRRHRSDTKPKPRENGKNERWK